MNKENIEYFIVDDKKDYYVTRWLKKPKKKVLIESRNKVEGKNLKLEIGVGKDLVTKVVNDFEKKKYYDYNQNKIYCDMALIASNYEIPVGLVRVILKGKGKIS